MASTSKLHLHGDEPLQWTVEAALKHNVTFDYYPDTDDVPIVIFQGELDNVVDVYGEYEYGPDYEMTSEDRELIKSYLE